MHRSALRRDSGYTVIELLAAVAVTGIVTAIAAVQVGPVRQAYAGDGAMRVVMAELNTARETAIAQRRLMEVSFIGADRLQVIRHDLPNGTTVLRDVRFESGMQYGLVTGVPDTPDAFGNSAAITFGSATTLEFNTDGALVDTSGSPVNGSVFVSLPRLAMSFRAVTVQGTTGRVRGYRWDGRQWKRV